MSGNRIKPRGLQTLLDFTAFFPRQSIDARSLAGLPRGDGGAVLVIPGIFHDDSQSARFRDALKSLGYTPFGWGLGANWGPNRHTMEGCPRLLANLARDHGPVRVVGYSLGGLFARWLAQSRPHLVRQVVTVCSPFRDPLHAAWLPVGPLARSWRDVDVGALVHMVREKPPMPWAAIYSPIDGIVGWEACLDPDAMDHCIEIKMRHRFALRETATLAAVAKSFAGQ